jgi:DNA recombination-mediator protein A
MAGVDARPWRAHGWKTSGRNGQPRPDFQRLAHRTGIASLACSRCAGDSRAPAAQRRGQGISPGHPESVCSHGTSLEYPQRLREIYDPPPLLYVRGNIELLNRHGISVVVSRRPSPYWNQMAERLARDLADRGLVIVSGLARGVGSSAHKGHSVPAASATIGVVGAGLR